jgi:hypothetical protein
MSNAIAISGSEYTLSGTVKKDKKGVLDLHVEVYDNDPIKDDFLGIGVTDATGSFSICFDSSKFTNFLDREPDLYSVVIDYNMELLSTKKQVINNATEDSPSINLVVDKLNTGTRDLINETPVDGWVGGFGTPEPSALDMLGNLENMKLLKRQQKLFGQNLVGPLNPKLLNQRGVFKCLPLISRG